MKSANPKHIKSKRDTLPFASRFDDFPLFLPNFLVLSLLFRKGW